MKKSAPVIFFVTLATAVISGIILYETLFSKNYLGDVGLVGIFISSMLSHLTIVGKDLFLITYLPLTNIYNPLLLGCLAGWGGAIGEISTYYWGLGVKTAIEEKKTNSDSFRWMEKYGLLAILLVAASPLPDTPIILLAGAAQFSVLKLFLVEGIGKTVLYTLGAVLGNVFFTNLTDIVGNMVASTIIVVVSLAFSIIVSWEEIRGSKRFSKLISKIMEKMIKKIK